MIRTVLVILVMLCSWVTAGATDALPMLNAQRAYFKLYPLRHDPALQREAQRRADQLVRARGPLRHLPGRRAGRYEGIGVRSGVDPIGRRFFTCGQNSRRYSRAGAATAVAGNKTYYCLIMR